MAIFNMCVVLQAISRVLCQYYGEHLRTQNTSFSAAPNSSI